MGYELSDDIVFVFIRKYMVLHLSGGRTYVLGLRDIVTKSVLSDIDERMASTSDNTAKIILSKIRNTMSVRAATEHKFNKLVEDYRKDILSHLIPNYANLPVQDKQVSKLNNLFCGLHALLHFPEVSQPTLLEVEQAHLDAKFPF